MLKKLLIAGLMGATALSALPAQAQDRDGPNRRKNGDGAQQTQRSAPQAPPAQVENRRERGEGDRGRGEARERGQADTHTSVRSEPRPDTQAPVRSDPRPDVQTSVRSEPRPPLDAGQPTRGRESGWQDGRGDGPRGRDRDGDNRRGDNRDWRDGRPGDGPGDRNRQNWDRRDGDRGNDWRDNRSWNKNWRNDRRYNWQDYRKNNRDRFRAGRYYAPRGWSYGYRPFSIGIYLNSILFSNSYWIDDPYDYRLPPAYGSLRWVRYYDDALLVDVRNGYVVDVIRDFFW